MQVFSTTSFAPLVNSVTTTHVVTSLPLQESEVLQVTLLSFYGLSRIRLCYNTAFKEVSLKMGLV